MNAHGRPGGLPGGRPARAAVPAHAAAGALRIVHVAIPTELARIRAAVSGWGQRAELSADVLVDLLLAVGEAVANAVDHAYTGARPGPVEVELRVLRRAEDRVVTARITDAGRWRPRSAPRDPKDRGRGIPMIRALATCLDITPTGHGTEVRLELAIPRERVQD